MKDLHSIYSVHNKEDFTFIDDTLQILQVLDTSGGADLMAGIELAAV